MKGRGTGAILILVAKFVVIGHSGEGLPFCDSVNAMLDNPFQSPQVDLTLADGAAPTAAYAGRLSLAAFGAWTGAKIGAVFGLVGGGVLGFSLAFIHLKFELGGPPVEFGAMDLMLAGGIGGAVLSAALGAMIGRSLGQICEWRQETLGDVAKWAGGVLSALGAAMYTTIGAALLFDNAPFNRTEWPTLSLVACGAYAAAWGFAGGLILTRRIVNYDRWRREQTALHGNLPV